MPRTPDARMAAAQDANPSVTTSGHEPVMPPGKRKPHTEAAKRQIRRSHVARALVEGKDARVRHSGYAFVAIREEIRDQSAIILALAPWLDERRDSLLVEHIARIVTRLRRLDTYLDSLPERELTISVSSLYARLEGQLARSLSEAALSPTSASRLGIDLMDIRARQRQMTEMTLARYAPKAKGAEPDGEAE